MRMYDPRVGKFLSADPLTRKYPQLTPYQFASNSPIENADLDGNEATVKILRSEVSVDRIKIKVNAAINIKIQVINLSSVPNSNIDLDIIGQQLGLDLESRPGGEHTANVLEPYSFKADSRHAISEVGLLNGGDYKNHDLTLNAMVFTEVTSAPDMSKVDNNKWVFALVDDIKKQPKVGDAAGLADAYGSGKMAIGDAKYFTRDNSFKLGRGLILHEVLHLLGTTDTYSPFKGLPGTDNSDNVMFSLTPNSKLHLTDAQVIQEVFPTTIGGLKNIFDPHEPYKQPT